MCGRSPIVRRCSSTVPGSSSPAIRSPERRRQPTRTAPGSRSRCRTPGTRSTVSPSTPIPGIAPTSRLPSADAGKRIYVYFEGAFQVADVYVNGQHLGQHRGGYTRFIFDATSAIDVGGDNVLAVKVSNADCSDCLPDRNARLFKGYGGLYRKVWIVKTNKYHVATTDYASSGVYITPSNVSAAAASVSIKTLVTNDDTVGKTFTVRNFLTDENENILLNLQKIVVVAAKTTVAVTQSGTVSSPQLWSKSSPYLYNVHADVWVDGAVKDSVHEHTGFRYYQLTSSDFRLNGRLDAAARREQAPGNGVPRQRRDRCRPDPGLEQPRGSRRELRAAGALPTFRARIRRGGPARHHGVGRERPHQQRRADAQRRQHHARDGVSELQPSLHHLLECGQRGARHDGYVPLCRRDPSRRQLASGRLRIQRPDPIQRRLHLQEHVRGLVQRLDVRLPNLRTTTGSPRPAPGWSSAPIPPTTSR